jgi:DNA primase
MSPRGVRQAGALFASRAGRRVLAGGGAGPAILAEGLTDFLALAAAAPGIPVLSAPGAGGAEKAVGDWARGRAILLALDCDEAGEAGAKRATRRISEAGGQPARLRWPGGAKDAADVAKERGFRWLGEELRRIVRAQGERP